MYYYVTHCHALCKHESFVLVMCSNSSPDFCVYITIVVLYYISEDCML